jgi:hypothetical protein
MWAVMFFGPLAHLTDLAGGVTPFDIRPKGYGYVEARAFLEVIGEQGRKDYAGPELVIDTFYPPFYALSRGPALWWLTMPGRVREVPAAAESTLRAYRCAVAIFAAILHHKFYFKDAIRTAVAPMKIPKTNKTVNSAKIA